jgi:hypothetical protein
MFPFYNNVHTTHNFLASRYCDVKKSVDFRSLSITNSSHSGCRVSAPRGVMPCIFQRYFTALSVARLYSIEW